MSSQVFTARRRALGVFFCCLISGAISFASSALGLGSATGAWLFFKGVSDIFCRRLPVSVDEGDRRRIDYDKAWAQCAGLVVFLYACAK